MSSRTMTRRSGAASQSTARSPSRKNVQAASALLARTSVYRLVPVPARRFVDRAILLRPEGCGTLDAIHRKYRLHERFGVTRAGLKTYARRLERLVQPVFAGHLLATVLGALPAGYRRQMTRGSHVLLLSRVVAAMTDNDCEMTPAGLAKLASSLASANRAASAAGQAKEACGPRNTADNDRRHLTDTSKTGNPAEIIRTVRAVYGLDWPSSDPASKPSGREPRSSLEK